MMNFEEKLDIYLRARFTLIVLVTPEEERAVEIIRQVCQHSDRPCVSWDISSGFQVICGNESPGNARDPLTALEYVERAEGRGLYVLKDFHEFWQNAEVKRKLRTVSQKLKFSKKTLIILTPISDTPRELRDDLVQIDFPQPNADEIEAVLDRLTKSAKVKINLTQLGREKLIQAALGMTASQAQRVFAKAIVLDGVLDDNDISLVTDEKRQIIRESEALEFYPVTETPDDVGGLDVLKDWLRLRERAFTNEAREYGLPFPKGIALIGIPGTGKSLTAKMIGGLWRLPLLRLDVGSLFGSLVGETEERTRRALRVAEAIAPCILWIDEMEKALSHGTGDSGTSTRVFGTILTWMQEKKAPCFVVGTANDVNKIPLEMLRKGRFDEIFFLDLPTTEERGEILDVHLKKRKRLPQDFDVKRLAAESEGYVGAEIEQAIIDSMYVGFSENREITTDDISAALKKQVPLSVSQRETIESLRRWLREGRAQSASFAEYEQAEEKFVPVIELEMRDGKEKK